MPYYYIIYISILYICIEYVDTCVFLSIISHLQILKNMIYILLFYILYYYIIYISEKS